MATAACACLWAVRHGYLPPPKFCLKSQSKKFGAGANLNQLVSALDLPLNLTGLANDQVSGAISDVADGLGAVVV